jgi:hypothetical protein
MPELMKDVKAVGDKKKAIQNAIDKYEIDKWTPIGF